MTDAISCYADIRICKYDDEITISWTSGPEARSDYKGAIETIQNTLNFKAFDALETNTTADVGDGKQNTIVVYGHSDWKKETSMSTVNGAKLIN